MNHTTCTAVLHIYLSLISMSRVDALIGRLQPLRQAAKQSPPVQNNLVTMGKIIGCVGRFSAAAAAEEQPLMAAIAVEDLIDLMRKCNAQNLPILLKEIEGWLILIKLYGSSFQLKDYLYDIVHSIKRVIF